MQTPLDAPFEQVQPDTTKIFAAPFLISDRVSKRALLFHRVFKRISYVNLPGFLWRSSAIRIPAFSFSKRALPLSILFPAVLLVQGGRLFCFLSILSRASKRALEEMEVKNEESEQS